MLSSHSLATTRPSTDSGSAVVQAIAAVQPGRAGGDLDAEQVEAGVERVQRGEQLAAAGADVDDGVQPGARGSSVTRAAANSGEACTEVRKCAAGASRRKNPSAPYRAASHACFHVGSAVGGGTARHARATVIGAGRPRP